MARGVAQSSHPRVDDDIDLRDFAQGGRWYILREGAVAREAVEQVLVAFLRRQPPVTSHAAGGYSDT